MDVSSDQSAKAQADLLGLLDKAAQGCNSLGVTRLPYLDIFDHTSAASENVAHDSRQLLPSRPLGTRAQLLAPCPGVTGLNYLQRFGKFILELTGTDDIAFRFRFWRDGRSSQIWEGLVRAEYVDDHDRCGASPELSLAALLPSEESKKTWTSLTDFALIITDGIRHDHSSGIYLEPIVAEHSVLGSSQSLPPLNQTFQLHVSSTENEPTVSALHIFGEIADVAFDTLAKSLQDYLLAEESQMKDASSGACRATPSILNFPPQESPCSIAGSAFPYLHYHFAKRAKDFPDRVAIDFVQNIPADSTPSPRTLWTYAQLDAASSHLAHSLGNYLISRNSEMRSEIIPVYMSTSPGLYAAFLGVLKAGCGLCPLPLDVPSARLRQMLEDVRPAVVIGAGKEPTDEVWRNATAGLEITWMDVEGFTPIPALEASHSVFQKPEPLAVTEPSMHQISPDDLAYIMYTSGSSGKPKGVLVSHLAACCAISSEIAMTGLLVQEAPVRWFQSISPTFDPCIAEIFVTLSIGGTLCAAPRELTLANLEGVIRETRAEMTLATPSVASLLRPKMVPTLRCVWTMGEMLNRQTITNFARNRPSKEASLTSTDFRPRELHNGYGPTETIINCTFYPHFVKDMRAPIIGWPFPTTSMFVMDTSTSPPRLVPQGFPGELLAGGPQLSQGYLNQPEQTAAAFFDLEPYGRLYRTGDKGRVVWDEYGRPVLEILGRLTDEQVKISGRRIELSEIDAAICSLRDISAAVTMRRVDAHTTRDSIIAYVVLEENADISMQNTKSILNGQLKRCIPQYMIPSEYVVRQSIPKTKSGKTDRRAVVRIIDEVFQSRSADRTSSSGESNALPKGNTWRSNEKLLQDRTIFTLVSALENIFELDSDANVLDTQLSNLGMNSLRAMRFLQIIRDEGITELSIKDLLSPVSVHDLRKLLQERSAQSGSYQDLDRQSPPTENFVSFAKRWNVTCLSALNLGSLEVEKILPTTVSQSRILLSFQNASLSSNNKTGPYIHHSLTRVPNDVNPKALRQAWTTVLQRHETYRTCFVPVSGDVSPFAQCILSKDSKASHLLWRQHDDSSEIIDQPQIDQAVTKAESLLTLERPPLILTLLRSSTEHAILLSIFHAIFDFGSLDLLFEEVDLELQGACPPVRTSLGQAVAACYREDLTVNDKFWDHYLCDFPRSSFPCLSGLRPEAFSLKTAVSFLGSTLTLGDIQSAVKSDAISPLNVMQAAWASILSSYSESGDAEVMFGNILSNRLEAWSDVCMAPTLSISPMRVRTRGESDRFRSVKEVILGIRDDHQDALKRSQPSLGYLSGVHGQKFYDTTLALQVLAARKVRRLRENTSFLPMTHDFAVMIEIWPEEDDKLTFKATYTNRVLDSEAATSMLQQFRDILIWMISNLDQPFVDAGFAVSSQLLSTLNAERCDPCGSLLHSQFQHHAAASPDKVALSFVKTLELSHPSNSTWTYSQLNQGADQLAIHLRRTYGPLHRCVVPILMEKSPELYLSILAILKSGASWCPIDLYSPASRKRRLILRTGAGILLVNRVLAEQELDSVPSGVTIVDVTLAKLPGADVKQVFASEELSAKPEDPAYLIWTSGTTGAPKGVIVSHAAASTSMESLRRCIISSNKDGRPLKCIQFADYTFDVFVQDVFYTWSSGGTLVSASRDLMVGSFSQLATLTNASHAHLTPAFARNLRPETCSTLEVITMIGEKLPQDVADRWGERVVAYNTYGPAEAAVVSTARRFGGPSLPLKSSNIGSPLPSMTCHVVKNGRAVLKHGVGELALEGPQLAQGYLDDPSRTSDRFIQTRTSSNRLYLTGDIVRIVGNGSLEYLGRTDDLVKINGIRVELSEISFELRHCHESVTGVETCTFPGLDRQKDVIVTFLTTARQKSMERISKTVIELGEPSVEVARAAHMASQQSLPEYMLPFVFIVLSHFPLTSSQKVDRKALQEIFRSVDLADWRSRTLQDLDAEEETHVIWTEREIEFLEILSSITKIEVKSIRQSDRLASLGIDSIVSAELLRMCIEAGVKISFSDIVQSRSVRDLLKKITQLPYTSRNVPVSVYLEKFHREWHPHVREDAPNTNYSITPVTNFQEAVLTETTTNSRAYWSNHFVEIPQDLDFDRFRDAWQATTNKNEAMRSAYLSTAEICHRPEDTESRTTFLQLIFNEYNVNSKIHLEYTSSQNLQAKAKSVSLTFSHNFRNWSNPMPPWTVTVFKTEEELLMMLSIHHALHDEDSIPAILEDVLVAYQNCQVKPNLRSQLRKILSFESVSSAQLDREVIGSWTQKFKGVDSNQLGALPDLTYQRSGSGYFAGNEMLSCSIPLSIPRGKFQEIARQLSVSPASMFKVAWGFLLQSYLETSVAFFGETISQRLRNPEIGDAVGPAIFVKPVLIRSDCTARELLAREEDCSRDTCRIPSTAALRQLFQQAIGQPLYSSVFVFHPDIPLRYDRLTQAGWKIAPDLVGLFVEHPLALNVHSRDWALEIFASSSYVSFDQLRLLSNQMDQMVSRVAYSPDKTLMEMMHELPAELLSMTDTSLSVGRNHPSALYATFWTKYYGSFHPTWTAVEVASEVNAIQTATQKWTFAELEFEAGKITRYLLGQGHSHQVIAMCMERSLESYAVMLGIFQSGNTYLPIDDALPVERKLFMLQDSAAAVLIVDSACELLFDCLEDLTTFNPSTHSIFKEPNDVRVSWPQVSIDPDSDAYLLYTSGSTGTPKGVRVSHRNLCNFIMGLSQYIIDCHPAASKYGGKGKFLGLASRSFDVHLCEAFLGWRFGLAAVTAPREALLDDLHLSITSLGVTHACFVPSLLDQAEITPSDVPDLVYFSVGGEKISQKILDIWGKQNQTLVVNAYGPTELAIGCCAAQIRSHSNVRNIGRPFGNTVAHVLLSGSFDYALKGQSGELCMTGDLVANGYHSRPGAEGFVQDFCGKRMYRTGDIVRMMADGSLEYLGRADDQMKIRGQRVELGEISESIRRVSETPVDVTTLVLKHPRLLRSQLVSFVAPLTERQKRYMARVELLQSNGERQRNIRLRCQQILPTYMVPDLIITATTIPLSRVSGKADSKALKTAFSRIAFEKLLGNDGSIAKENEEERDLTETERLVANAVRDIVGTEPLRIHPSTSIFELGLDSLRAIGLAAVLRRLGFDCNISKIFTEPTIQGMASFPIRLPDKGIDGADHEQNQVLMEYHRETQGYLKLPADLGSVEAIRPCMPLQEAMIARTINSTSENLYMSLVVLELNDDLDPDLFSWAWKSLIASNPILRTVFWQVRDKYVQVVRSEQPVGLPWVSLQQNQDENLMDSFERFYEEAKKQVVDKLDSVPPFRLAYCKPESRSPHLGICIHHSLYDGESFELMIRDLYLRYHGIVSEKHTSFDSLLAFILRSDEAKQRSFWLSHLEECTKYPMLRSYGDQSETGTAEKTLSASLESAQTIATKFKTTLSTLFQCIYASVMGQHLRRRDFVFGLVLSGRIVPVEGAETIMAPCLTTIPQRIDLGSKQAKLSQIIQNTHEASIRCLKFQHTPLRSINRWLNSDTPLFDTLFTYLGARKTPEYHRLWRKLPDRMPVDYPFALELEPLGEENKLLARCSFTSVFGSSDSATSVLENLDSLLMTLLREEDLEISRLGLKDDRSRNQHIESKVWGSENYSEQEIMIKDLLKNSFGVDAALVSKDTSFFRLGIDSVTAIRFAKKLRELGLPVHSADIMQFSCIGALGQRLLQTKGQFTDPGNTNGGYRSNINGFARAREASRLDAIYPCTPLQIGMITESLAAEDDPYQHHHILRLSYTIDRLRLHQAWDDLRKNNDILRTGFYYVPEHTWRWIAKVSALDDTETCFSQTAGTLKDILQQLRHSTSQRSVEDFQRPPLNATLVKDGSESYLILSMHHCLYDGQSLPMMLADLERLYKKYPLPQRVPFFEAANLISHRLEGSVGYWQNLLETFNPPPSTKQTENDAAAVGFERRTIDIESIGMLDRCRELEVTPQAVSIFAFGKLLCSLQSQKDVVFGRVVSGRSIPIDDCEKINGPLFNTLPMRFRLDDPLKSNKKSVQEMQALLSGSQMHQHASLAAVQNAWRAGNPTKRTHLIDAIFLFQRADGTTTSADSLWELIEEGDSNTAPYNLNFEVEQFSDSLVVQATSRESFLSKKNLAKCLDLFEEILVNTIKKPNRFVDAYLDHPILRPAEKPEHHKQQRMYVNPQELVHLDEMRHILSEVSAVAVRDIHPQTSIFHIGIDSITAAKVARLCRKRNLSASIADIVLGETLIGICRRIYFRQTKTLKVTKENPFVLESEVSNFPWIDPGRVEAVLPCLSGQEYHLASWSKSGRARCESVFAFEPSKKLLLDRLLKAWSDLRSIHPVLRTVFACRPNQRAIQIIQRPSTDEDRAFCSVLDPAEPFSSAEADAAKLTREIKRETFDLFTPPVRLFVVRRSPRDLILLKLHHAVYDAWSLPMILSDLWKLYKGDTLMQQPTFTNFVKTVYQEHNTHEEIKYWGDALRRWQRTILRSHGSEDTENKSYRLYESVSNSNAIQHASKLEKVCHQHGTTLPTVIVLAFARRIAIATNVTSPCFGYYHLGRSRGIDGSEMTPGPCLNVTPFMVRSALSRSTSELVREIRSDLTSRTPFEQASLASIHEWAGIGGDPLFNTELNIIWRHQSGELSENSNLFKPIRIVEEDANDYNECEGPTAVEGLELPVAADGLYLDAVLDDSRDCVQLAVKCASVLMNKCEVQLLLTSIAKSVRDAVGDLHAKALS